MVPSDPPCVAMDTGLVVGMDTSKGEEIEDEGEQEIAEDLIYVNVGKENVAMVIVLSW